MTSTLPAGMAVEAVTASSLSHGGVVADVHVDAGVADGSSAGGSRKSLPETAWPIPARARATSGHPRTAHADHVQAQRSGEVERRTGRFEGRESR